MDRRLNERDTPAYLEAMAALEMTSDPMGGDRPVDIQHYENVRAHNAASDALKAVTALTFKDIRVKTVKKSSAKPVK